MSGLKNVTMGVIFFGVVSGLNQAALAQRGGPSPSPQPPVEGPEAAVAFASNTCGTFIQEAYYCTNAHPVDYAETKNIIPMTPKLWTPEQIIEDYKKNRKPGQVGAIVLLKTEFCYQRSALCSVTTAAFEKHASKFSKLYRVYGTWLYKSTLWAKDANGKWDRNDSDDDTMADWEKDVYDTYSFEQGPGSNIIFLDPRDNEIIYRTDAASLGMDMETFLNNNGNMPLLNQALVYAFNLLQMEKKKETHVVWIPTPIGIPFPIIWNSN